MGLSECQSFLQEAPEREGGPSQIWSTPTGLLLVSCWIRQRLKVLVDDGL